MSKKEIAAFLYQKSLFWKIIKWPNLIHHIILMSLTSHLHAQFRIKGHQFLAVKFQYFSDEAKPFSTKYRKWHLWLSVINSYLLWTWESFRNSYYTLLEFSKSYHCRCQEQVFSPDPPHPPPPWVWLTCCPSQFWVVFNRNLTFTQCFPFHATFDFPKTLWILCIYFLGSLCSPGSLPVLCMCHCHLPGVSFVLSQNGPCGGTGWAPSAAVHAVAAAGLVMEKNCPVGWGNGQQ